MLWILHFLDPDEYWDLRQRADAPMNRCANVLVRQSAGTLTVTTMTSAHYFKLVFLTVSLDLIQGSVCERWRRYLCWDIIKSSSGNRQVLKPSLKQKWGRGERGRWCVGAKYRYQWWTTFHDFVHRRNSIWAINKVIHLHQWATAPVPATSRLQFANILWRWRSEWGRWQYHWSPSKFL